MIYGSPSDLELGHQFQHAMRFTSVAIFLILFCAWTVTAQDKQCTLKLTQLPDAPELFGFRIGMTKDQVKARVPQVVFGKTKGLGVLKTSINPDFDPRIDKSTFAGVRTVSLDFLDDRITSLWLGYDSSFKWRTIPEFIEGISQSLRLPQAWSPWKSRGQQLRCVDFTMTVTIVAEGPSFRIVDENAENTLTMRREAEQVSEEASEESSETIIADRQKKIYYSSGCRPENQIKESDRAVFSKVEDAEKAGYQRAKHCQ
jgi:hypothetical protein